MENTEPLLQTDDNGFTVKDQPLVKFYVFSFLLFDYLIVTMPIPILPHELSCSASKFDSLRLGCVGDELILIIFASKPAVQLVFAPYFGKWIDRQGARTPLLVSAVILCFSTLFFTAGLALNQGYADTATVVCPLLLLARMVEGIGSSGVNSAGLALVNMSFPPDERGSATSVVMGGIGLGVLAGPIMSGLLALFLGSWLPFAMVLIPFGVATCVFSATSVGSTTIESTETPKHEEAVFNAWKDPSVLIVGAVIMLANMVIGLAEPLLPLYVSKPPFSFGYIGQTIVFSVMTLSYIIWTGVLGVLADKHAKWKFLAAGMVMMLGVGGVVMTEQLWVVIVCIILMGSGMAAIDIPASPLLAEIIESHGSKDYGQAATVQNICTALGFAAGPLVGAGGMFCTASVSAMRWETSVLAVLSALLFLLSFQLRGTDMAAMRNMP